MECQHNLAALADQCAPGAQLIRSPPSVKFGVKGQSHMASAAASDRRRSRAGAASSPMPAGPFRRQPRVACCSKRATPDAWRCRRCERLGRSWHFALVVRVGHEWERYQRTPSLSRASAWIRPVAHDERVKRRRGFVRRVGVGLGNRPGQTYRTRPGDASPRVSPLPAASLECRPARSSFGPFDETKNMGQSWELLFQAVTMTASVRMAGAIGDERVECAFSAHGT